MENFPRKIKQKELNLAAILSKIERQRRLARVFNELTWAFFYAIVVRDQRVKEVLAYVRTLKYVRSLKTRFKSSLALVFWQNGCQIQLFPLHFSWENVPLIPGRTSNYFQSGIRKYACIMDLGTQIWPDRHFKKNARKNEHTKLVEKSLIESRCRCSEPRISKDYFSARILGMNERLLDIII